MVRRKYTVERFLNKLMGIAMLTIVLLIAPACNNKKSKRAVVFYDETSSQITVPYNEEYGVKFVDVKVNDMPLRMILDTGCSVTLISSLELTLLYKNGKISEDDILDKTVISKIADGSLVKNGIVILRKVELAENLIFNNVEAHISDNPNTPLLLGNNILSQKAQMTIDQENQRIIFTPY